MFLAICIRDFDWLSLREYCCILIIIQYVGPVAFGNGDDITNFIGLELDRWNPNGHDGTIEDKSYFKTKDGYGYFVKLEDLMANMGPLRISDFVFYARSGDDETEKYKFEELWQFQIPCNSLFERMDVPRSVDIYAKYDGDSMDFVRIASMMKRRYTLKRDTPLHLGDSILIPLNDRLIIECTSDILIAPKAVIEGSDSMIDAKEAKLVLVSSGNIENHGTLCRKGLGDCDGGDIYILANSFVNEGTMDCTPNGRTFVFCREYANNGVIIPEPALIYIGTEVFVNHFMFCVQFESDPIINKEAFFQRIGTRFERKWIPSLMEHELLFKESRCDGLRVVDRLSDELEIPFFQLLNAAGSSIGVNTKNEITFHETSELKVLQTSEFLFCVGVVDGGEDRVRYSEMLQFEDINQFSIPFASAWELISDALNVTIFCKAADDAFPLVPIHHLVLPRYEFTWKTPFTLTKSVHIPSVNLKLGQKGCLQIKNTSDIIIAANVTVNADS